MIIISHLDTLKIGTESVFSIFLATAFCIPSIATIPSKMGTAPDTVNVDKNSN